MEIREDVKKAYVNDFYISLEKGYFKTKLTERQIKDLKWEYDNSNDLDYKYGIAIGVYLTFK